MCYILIAVLGLSGTLEQLGSEKYPVRERAEARLRKENVTGFLTAWAGQNHSDPEIATRCRRIVAESDGFWRWFDGVAWVFLVAYPADEGETWELPGWLSQRLDRFTEYYYLDVGNLEYQRREYRGVQYDGN